MINLGYVDFIPGSKHICKKPRVISPNAVLTLAQEEVFGHLNIKPIYMLMAFIAEIPRDKCYIINDIKRAPILHLYIKQGNLIANNII